MSARVSSPVLIGRVPQVATLEDALTRSAGGEPVVVVVGGEAGIGKSRLVQEAADRARGRGAVVLEGGCISLGSDEGLPFAPIAEALRNLVRSLDRASLDGLLDPSTRELGRLVPELLGGGETSGAARPPSEWAQTRLFDAFLLLLGRLGERGPVVLVVEDVHWADRSTRDLLSFVARRLRDERVLVIVTYRTDELHRRHPLRPWLAEVGRLSNVEDIDLGRFDMGELAEQLAAIQGRPAAPDLVDQIARRSEGNPFFAEELLAAGGTRPGTLPSRLRDVLLGRIGSLSPAAGRLLAAASVAGGAVDHDLLRAVLDVDDATLTAALDEAVSAHLLVPADVPAGAGYAFRHALLGEAVYDELLASERRRLHGAYADALAGRPTPEGAAGASTLAALAHHATAANDLAMGLRASIASARASQATSGFYEAARAYERALALWDSVTASDRPAGEEEVELLYEAASALHNAQEPERARDVARLAVDRVDAAREPLRAARIEERLAWAMYAIGDLAGATSLLAGTVDRLDGLPPSVEGAGCLASLATFIFYGGRYRDATSVAEQAIAASRSVGARGREVEAMGVLGAALAIHGDCDRGLRVLREGLAMAHEVGEPDPIAMAYLGLASTLYDCNQLEASVEVGRESSAWARGIRLPGLQSMAVEGLVPLGRWEEASAILSDIPPALQSETSAPWEGVFAGLVAVRSGRLDEAQALHAIRQDEALLLTDAAFAGNLGGALLELALTEGRLDDARALAAEGLDWLADADDVRFRSRVLRLAVSAEAELAVVARARRDAAVEAAARARGVASLERIDGLLATYADNESPVFDEARGNRALAAAETTRLLDRPDPSAWVAAAAWFTVPRRPYELAYCHYRRAEAMLELRAGRLETAAVLGEARSLAAELGAGPLGEAIAGLARIARLELPPATATRATDGEAAAAVIPGSTPEPVDDPFGLTAREREVLVLLAAGQTNRAIAQTLYISESTASVHVSNIIGKLGVTNRVEAAATAVRSGLAG